MHPQNTQEAPPSIADQIDTMLRLHVATTASHRGANGAIRNYAVCAECAHGLPWERDERAVVLRRHQAQVIAVAMPSGDQVAARLAGHIACYGGSDEAYAVTCSCDRYGRPMGYGREGATVHARHAAEQIVALWREVTP